MQEWYLLKPPSGLGGFENELLSEYDDTFSELLESDFADLLILYQNDMSECWNIRGIVENKVQDTKMQSLNRMVLLPIGTAKTGMYIKYKERFWLIVNLMDDNNVYEKAVITYCNYLLTWINDSGKVIQRWANITSAAQYNNGLTVNYYYTTRSDQLMICMSNDFEALTLETGKRFIIDKRCSLYEESLDAEELNNLNIKWVTYEIARLDNVTFDYITSGYSEYLAVQDELHDNDGYYMIDDKGYWLCDYSPTSDNKTPISLKWNIIKDSDKLIAGINGQKFYAELYDEDGNELSTVSNAHWTVDCNFKDALRIEAQSNYIEIYADNKYIGNTFTLTLFGENYSSDSVDIQIVGMF